MKHEFNSATTHIVWTFSGAALCFGNLANCGSEGSHLKTIFTPIIQEPHPSQPNSFSACYLQWALLGGVLAWHQGLLYLFYLRFVPFGFPSKEGLVPGGRVSGGVRKTLLPTLTAPTRYSGAGRSQRWHSPARICEGRNASRQVLYPSLWGGKEDASSGPRGRDEDP
jgi:hypothetical protein